LFKASDTLGAPINLEGGGGVSSTQYANPGSVIRNIRTSIHSGSPFGGGTGASGSFHGRSGVRITHEHFTGSGDTTAPAIRLAGFQVSARMTGPAGPPIPASAFTNDQYPFIEIPLVLRVDWEECIPGGPSNVINAQAPMP